MHYRLEVEYPHDCQTSLTQIVAKRLSIPESHIVKTQIIRQTIDARARHPKPVWHVTLNVQLSKQLPKRSRRFVQAASSQTYKLESPRASNLHVTVVGAGPSGLFCAWHLAEQGVNVHLIERGKPVETRARDFGRFRGHGILDPQSNICFGEGGAGTYSDGKLYTRKNDPLIQEVLNRMISCGAPERIQIDAKPHIGTNKLFRMLQNIRQQLIDKGVTIQFQTQMTKLVFDKNKKISAVETVSNTSQDNKLNQIDTKHVVLAIGHSARDSFEYLHSLGIPMEAKPFAVGVRAEHPQALIDNAQYRCNLRPETLPPADYRLAAQTDENRGVYSFCMCPGGMIIPSSTEPEMMVVNGMSSARRSTPFANSGIVVQVDLQDLVREGFGTSPLSGIEFQRHLEKRAFQVGGKNYFAPAARASDLLQNKVSQDLPDSHFRPGLTASNLNDCLPHFVVEGLRQGLKQFENKIKGFASNQATLIAVESRTSSPIRIPRAPDTHEVLNFDGLYVTGEGPGYAGGIMSAAIDGLKTAQAILRKHA